MTLLSGIVDRFSVVALCGWFCAASALAQTEGSARLQVTLKDYNGAGAEHWTVVWVTTSSGSFINTLWKQGPIMGSTHWNSHCGTWYSAKAGSTTVDGYSGATAWTYSGTNSPVILTWNCRNAAGQLVPDGDYKFWVQYAEDNGQGPYTTSGLLWTKGRSSATYNYANQGSNFAGMQVVWTSLAPAVAPAFSGSHAAGQAIHVNGTGTVHQTFYVAASTNLDLPIEQWTLVSTNQIDIAGNFTNVLPVASPQMYYRLILP